MYPVLFQIGPISIETYYVIWGIALTGAILWMRRRCVERIGASYDHISDVLTFALIGVFLGAGLGGYVDNWRRYAEDPIRILKFWQSGMSSGPGFLLGGLFAMHKLRKAGISINAFAEAVSLPVALMLAVGRWGCFFSGCCRGLPSSASCAVIYPGSAEPVLPSQIFESAACFVIAAVLFAVERIRYGKKGKFYGDRPILWPIFIISYGSYRLIADIFRSGDRILGLRVGQYFGILAVILGIVWAVAPKLKRRQRSVDDSRR